MTKILVVEDEEPLREEILDMLGFEGFEAIGAENGRAGVEAAFLHQPDLIVCDIMMPELDGYGVLRELQSRSATAAIPFLFLTAKADRSDIRKGMGLGADDYLTKPFTRTELLIAIRARLVRRSRIVEGLEDELEQARKKLIRMVAHELRTPLVSVSMVSNIISLKMGQLGPETLKDLLGMLDTGSRRLKHLVEQMVLFTQLEAGALSQDSIQESGAPMSLPELLTATLDLARQFAFRGAAVNVRLDSRDQELEVKCDSSSLKFALAELVANALNFSPEDGEVVVSQWQAANSVWINIVDQGKGIPPEALKRATQEFQQIDREVQEQQGMGMGIPLAKRIIEAHGGTLALNSTVGVGTQVLVGLPAIGKTAYART